MIEHLGLIEHRTGEPEPPGDFGDGGLFDMNAAEHLVPDLHEVVWVEELVALEQGIGHLLGARVQGTLPTQGVAFGVREFGHRDLRLSTSQCQSNYALSE